jgi:hypothetical protein
MKIKQICFIISVIALTAQLNLRQNDVVSSEPEQPVVMDTSTNTNIGQESGPAKTTSSSTDTSSEKTAPASTITLSPTATKPSIETQQSSSNTQQAVIRPDKNSHTSYNEVKLGRPFEQPSIMRPTAMIPNTPVCARPPPILTPAPIASPLISTQVISTPVLQAIVRPYARVLPTMPVIPSPPSPPLRVFVPEHTVLGPPVHQPSPLVEALGIQGGSRVAIVPPSASAVISQQGIAVSDPIASVANPTNEKDIKITVNKKKKGKIELTISSKPKENNI